MRVEVLTDHPAERFRPGAVLHLEGSDEPLTIASAGPVADGPGWRLVFRELADRTAAETLRGGYLEAVLDSTEARGRGEYFWHDIIGNAVKDVDGTELGRVHDIYRVGETEVLVVRGGPPGEFDVPVVRSLIRVFAPKRGEIVVDGTALDLGAPPLADGPRPKAPRRRTRRLRGGGDSDPTSATEAGLAAGPVAPAGDESVPGEPAATPEAAPAPGTRAAGAEA